MNGLDIQHVLRTGAQGRILFGVWNTRAVAVKQSHRGYTTETRILRSLPPHPNIVTFLGTCLISGCESQILTLAKTDMLEMLLANNDISDETALGMVVGLLSGTAHVHRCGIMHGDIKLDNVLLDERMCVRLADFGHATAVEPNVRYNMSYGNKNYAAPECLDRAIEQWTRRDVASFLRFAGCSGSSTSPFQTIRVLSRWQKFVVPLLAYLSLAGAIFSPGRERLARACHSADVKAACRVFQGRTIECLSKKLARRGGRCGEYASHVQEKSTASVVCLRRLVSLQRHEKSAEIAAGALQRKSMDELFPSEVGVLPFLLDSWAVGMIVWSLGMARGGRATLPWSCAHYTDKRFVHYVRNRPLHGRSFGVLEKLLEPQSRNRMYPSEAISMLARVTP